MSEQNAIPPPDWELVQAFEYSRHYDNLVWLVTSLLTTANVALFAIAADNSSIQVGLVGVALSDLTVYFAASFRLLRFRAQTRVKELGLNPHWLYSGLRGVGAQWLVYVLFFASLATLWVWQLIVRFPGWRGFWWSLLALSFGLLTWLYSKARSDPRRQGRA